MRVGQKGGRTTANSPIIFPGPTVLWESTAPCTLPTTRRLRTRRDSVTRNLPKLLSVIVILDSEFPLSWLLGRAGPAISSLKSRSALARKEKELMANSLIVFPGSTLFESTALFTLPTTRKLRLMKRVSKDAVTWKTYQCSCWSLLSWHSCWCGCWWRQDQRFRLWKYRWTLASRPVVRANSPILFPAIWIVDASELRLISEVISSRGV